MLLFAHAGITLGAAVVTSGIVQSIKPKEKRAQSWLAGLAGYLDIRWLLVGALLPDIIDKPLGQFILYGYIGTGRAYAHTLVFLAFITVLGLVVRFGFHRTWGLALAFGTLAHHILDYLWVSPEVWYWPFYGWHFVPIDVYNWWPEILRTLVTTPLVFIPELIGLAILGWFGIRLLQRNKVGAFLLRGDTGA